MSLGDSIGSSLGRAIGAALSGGSDYVSIVENGVLASFVTFTRASSGTYYDSAGVLQTALTNVQRKTYDPSTLALCGLLIEEARTNLVLNSATLVTQSVTVAAVAHTLSFYGTGTVTLSGASTAGPLIGTGATDRVTLTFTPTAGSLTLTVTGTVTVAQLEAGAVATSYIPTTSAAVTRAADNGVLNTLSTIGYNALEGTFYAEVMRPALGGNAFVAEFYLSSGNRISLGNNVAGGGVTEWDCYVQNASVDQAWLRSVTAVAGQPAKIAFAWKANDFALSVDGGAAITDVSGSLPSPTTMAVGRNGVGTRWLNGYIKNLRYYPRRLTNAELIGLTA